MAAPTTTARSADYWADLRARVVASRRTQGLADHVTDRRVLEQVAAAIRTSRGRHA